MRWARLFDDVAAQLEAAERAERDAESAELRRLETSRVVLAGRLLANPGAELTIAVDGCPLVVGSVTHVGADWLLLRSRAGAETVLALAAVRSLTGLPVRSVAVDDDDLDRRLGLGAALRRLARERTAVAVALRSGEVHAGTIDRVGADYLDLAEHPPDRPRRAGEVQQVRTVPFAAIALVRPA